MKQPKKPCPNEEGSLSSGGTSPRSDGGRRQGLQEIIRFWQDGAPGSDIVYADPNDAVREEFVIGIRRQVVRRTRYPHARTFTSGDDHNVVCILDRYVGTPSFIDTNIYTPTPLRRNILVYYYEPIIIWIVDRGITVKVISYNPITHWFQPIYPQNGEYLEIEGFEMLENASNSCNIF
ncbi:MAG: hypothetical protein MJ014_00180 [Methanocorpusculum sp.]|nr:hypothetical protein [Methanocorpusculum sp.]